MQFNVDHLCEYADLRLFRVPEDRGSLEEQRAIAARKMVLSVAGRDGALAPAGTEPAPGLISYLPGWLLDHDEENDPVAAGCQVAAGIVIVPQIALVAVDLFVGPRTLILCCAEYDAWPAYQRVAKLLRQRPQEFERPSILAEERKAAALQAEADAAAAGRKAEAAAARAEERQAAQARTTEKSKPVPRSPVTGWPRVVRDVERDWLPTGSKLLFRTPVFEPVMTPNYRRTPWLSTTWGRARVTGRLGGPHSLLFSAILRAGTARILEGGDVEVVVRMAALWRLGVPRGGGTAKKVLDDLFKAEIEIEADATKARPAIHARGRLVGDIVTNGGAPAGAGGAELAGSGKTLTIRLGRFFLDLWAQDLCVYDDRDRLQALSALRSGAARAAARFCTTHRFKDGDAGYTPRFLLKTVKGLTKDPARGELHDFQRDLRRDALRLAAGYGLTYADGHLRPATTDELVSAKAVQSKRDEAAAKAKRQARTARRKRRTAQRRAGRPAGAAA